MTEDTPQYEQPIRVVDQMTELETKVLCAAITTATLYHVKPDAGKPKGMELEELFNAVSEYQTALFEERRKR